VAYALIWLIGSITNLAFYHRLSAAAAIPQGHHLGAWAMLVPVAGALVVGFMARFGSEKTRGHGIPEALEATLKSYPRQRDRGGTRGIDSESGGWRQLARIRLWIRSFDCFGLQCLCCPLLEPKPA
jgi:hypothetical protein